MKSSTEKGQTITLGDAIRFATFARSLILKYECVIYEGCASKDEFGKETLELDARYHALRKGINSMNPFLKKGGE